MQATTERTEARDTDLHSGLDYERARKRLDAIASVKFKEFIAVMGDSDSTVFHQARKAYQAARNAASDLHPRDAEAIAEVLRGEA